MLLNELYDEIRKILPDAQFETDNYGQVIVYTKKMVQDPRNECCQSMGDWAVIDFDLDEVKKEENESE
jgi:hypothetical protein